MTVSVIIPVCNTEKYVARCLDSVLGQSYKDLEVLVINDGSSGDIDTLIRDYLEADSRVRYLRHEENRGLVQARITGMEAATGEYVAFLDSDDYISYDFYRTLLAKARETGADITVGRTVWEEDERKEVFTLHETALRFDTLSGDAIREAYFSQEANCYAWHTVWNKLYRGELIRRCLPEFQKLQGHIVMTEDIFFSSILFYEARLAVRVEEEAYFYCANKNASTNVSKITLAKFLKNIADITAVFRAVEAFLQSRKGTKELLAHFANARVRYARMWRNLLDASFTGEEHMRGLRAIAELCPQYTMESMEREYFFESIRAPWNGVLEYFKEQIGKGKEAFISFDMFDTLVTRPFYQPADLLSLLDGCYTERTGSFAKFSALRISAERMARETHAIRHPLEQDITIEEIYTCLEKTCGIEPGLCREMMACEQALEVQYSLPRQAGKSLYEMAKACGKRILITTDMYLDRETIQSILEKNGFDGYEQIFISSEDRKLKYTGDLFRVVLDRCGITADNLLHFGDTWTSDIEGSKLLGIRSFFLPKSREFFENGIQDYPTNRCAVLDTCTAGPLLDTGKLRDNLGYRTMLGFAARYYFDIPYRPFCRGSDLGGDPGFIGYYTLGMHMLGLCKWLDQQMADRPDATLYFLSRDGYLPMKAYDLYCKRLGKKSKIGYLQTSRKALLPMICKDALSFYQLPVEYRAHSPRSILKLLKFASRPVSQEETTRLLAKAGLRPEEKLRTEKEFFAVIHCFLEYLYSREIHEAAKDAVRRYFSRVRPGDVAFDMGYSGRIQAAISQACGFGMDVLFIHEDYRQSTRLKASGDFRISAFYDFVPTVTGLFREHLFSDWQGSCIGYTQRENGVMPVLEDWEKCCSDAFVVGKLQESALQFMEDFLGWFAPVLPAMDYSAQCVSLPFEGFLRCCSNSDLRIFHASYFEDEVYGANSEIQIDQFIRQQKFYADSGLRPKETAAVQSPEYENNTFRDILETKRPFVRAALWMLVDFKQFSLRVWKHLRIKLKTRR